MTRRRRQAVAVMATVACVVTSSTQSFLLRPTSCSHFSLSKTTAFQLAAARNGTSVAVSAPSSRSYAAKSRSRRSSSTPVAASSGNRRKNNRKAVFQQQLDTKNTQTPPKYKKKGKQFSRYDPLDHEILTPDQEKILGRKIQRANALKTKINGVLETKKALREKQLRAEERFISSALYGDYYDEEDFADLTVYNSREEALEEFERDSYSTMASSYTMESDTEEDTVLFEQDGDDNNDLLSSGSSPFEGLVDSGNSILSEATLSDAEIASLGVSGGRDKLYKILLEGALARDKMIRSNIRLVVSIAKKWARDTAGGMMGDGISSILYEGSSSRPSLDEAIQEGILGLAKAADRFDPERGFKFGTYATWWITNHVRKTYNSAITGSIRVPPNYHIVRQKYKKQVNAYRREHDREPAFDDVASEMGIKPERLRFILQSTQTIVSLDAPLGPGNWVGGGQAYVNNDGNAPSIKDTIECMEPKPEEQVELSLLRQCLENAMATELSPHERDIIRLRLGLDDGVSRSVKDVIEVCGGTLSYTEVRNAELRAFNKLRAPYAVHTEQLLAYLHFIGVTVDTLPEKRIRRP